MNALVTGAYGNLGRAVVEKFLAEGFTVSGTIAPNEIAPPIEHSKFSATTIDLTNEEVTLKYINQFDPEKSLDVAVFTVGGFAKGGIEETSLEDIRKMMKLNFDTAYNCVRPLLTGMKKRGKGRIFVVGARPALSAKNGKGMTAYSLSKALLIRFAELVNEEAKGKDIWTTVIVPSTIDTPQNRASMPDAEFSKWVKPEKIAELIFEHYSQRKRDLLVFTD